MCAFSVLPRTWSGLGQVRLFIKPLVLYNFYFRDYEFRPGYGKLATLAAIFPSKPFQALKATARLQASGCNYRKVWLGKLSSYFGKSRPSQHLYKVMSRSSSVKETNDDQELGFELKQLKTIPSNHCLYITSFVSILRLSPTSRQLFFTPILSIKSSLKLPQSCPINRALTDGRVKSLLSVTFNTVGRKNMFS